ncbi:hypothetical protein ACIP1G_23820 [Pseudomonas sp. NPDC089392]|uniref:hypothetical protein n=1 Tax=Pseudomonas sp. NPDC089392 TaxID=3364459 RepID=UPI0038121055
MVNRAVVQIDRLPSQVGATGEAINALRSESQRIGKVMEVIKARGQHAHFLLCCAHCLIGREAQRLVAGIGLQGLAEPLKIMSLGHS